MNILFPARFVPISGSAQEEKKRQMKETLYTIPLTDAFHANDECPLCFVEREVEQDLLDLVLGSSSSHMESDMREMTDKAGFCRAHFKKCLTTVTLSEMPGF